MMDVLCINKSNGEDPVLDYISSAKNIADSITSNTFENENYGNTFLHCHCYCCDGKQNDIYTSMDLSCINRRRDKKSKYWCFLLEELSQIIIEIHNICEKNGSLVQCKEIRQILQNYCRDFQNLYSKLQSKKEQENTYSINSDQIVKGQQTSFLDLHNIQHEENIAGIEEEMQQTNILDIHPSTSVLRVIQPCDTKVESSNISVPVLRVIHNVSDVDKNITHVESALLKDSKVQPDTIDVNCMEQTSASENTVCETNQFYGIHDTIIETPDENNIPVNNIQMPIVENTVQSKSCVETSSVSETCSLYMDTVTTNNSIEEDIAKRDKPLDATKTVDSSIIVYNHELDGEVKQSNVSKICSLSIETLSNNNDAKKGMDIDKPLVAFMPVDFDSLIEGEVEKTSNVPENICNNNCIKKCVLNEDKSLNVHKTDNLEPPASVLNNEVEGEMKQTNICSAINQKQNLVRSNTRNNISERKPNKSGKKTIGVSTTKSSIKQPLDRHTISSISMKTASKASSPRKPIPGRNVAAPVFIPRYKDNATSIHMKPLQCADTIVDSKSNTNKTSLPRSHSIPVIETNKSPSQHATRKLKYILEKQYVSTESLNTDMHLNSEKVKTSISDSILSFSHVTTTAEANLQHSRGTEPTELNTAEIKAPNLNIINQPMEQNTAKIEAPNQNIIDQPMILNTSEIKTPNQNIIDQPMELNTAEIKAPNQNISFKNFAQDEHNKEIYIDQRGSVSKNEPTEILKSNDSNFSIITSTTFDKTEPIVKNEKDKIKILVSKSESAKVISKPVLSKEAPKLRGIESKSRRPIRNKNVFCNRRNESAKLKTMPVTATPTVRKKNFELQNKLAIAEIKQNSSNKNKTQIIKTIKNSSNTIVEGNKNLENNYKQDIDNKFVETAVIISASDGDKSKSIELFTENKENIQLSEKYSVVEKNLDSEICNVSQNIRNTENYCLTSVKQQNFILSKDKQNSENYSLTKIEQQNCDLSENKHCVKNNDLIMKNSYLSQNNLGTKSFDLSENKQNTEICDLSMDKKVICEEKQNLETILSKTNKSIPIHEHNKNIYNSKKGDLSSESTNNCGSQYQAFSAELVLKTGGDLKVSKNSIQTKIIDKDNKQNLTEVSKDSCPLPQNSKNVENIPQKNGHLSCWDSEQKNNTSKTNIQNKVSSTPINYSKIGNNSKHLVGKLPSEFGDSSLILSENLKSNKVCANFIPRQGHIVHQKEHKNWERKYPNMVRSKTSVDMNVYKRDFPPRPLNSSMKDDSKQNIQNSNKDLKQKVQKSRKFSVDEDGWEVVTTKSRKSISSLNSNNGSTSNIYNNNNGNKINCNNNGNKCSPKAFSNFHITRRFYEPSPSSSLPSLFNFDLTKKSEMSQKYERGGRNKTNGAGNVNNNKKCNDKNDDNNNNNNNCNDSSNTYKSNKEKPIISNASLFITVPNKMKRTLQNDKKVMKKKNGNGERKKNLMDDEKSSLNISELYDKELSEMKADDDLINEESIRRNEELCEKEKLLEKEIHYLENMEIEVDTESDDIECNEVDDLELTELCDITSGKNLDEKRIILEEKYSHLLADLPWAEQIEILEKLEQLMILDPTGKSLNYAKRLITAKQLQDFVARYPGRSSELSQSSSKHRSHLNTVIISDRSKQSRQQQNCEQLLQDKCAKLKELINRIDEVKLMDENLREERRKMFEQKMKRAEENRNLHLRNIQEKAHDEAKKLKEIAFINELEAQNKRHYFYLQCQVAEVRLQGIMEERQRKQEERAAKDAAVEERRKTIQANRQLKLEEFRKRAKKRKERASCELEEKGKERVRMFSEKTKVREDKRIALKANNLANVEKLQKKIQKKYENSTRRYEENMEQIRQRAVEFGGLRSEDTPALTPYETDKLCSVCNVLIDSEVFLLSHMKGRSHQESVKKYKEQLAMQADFNEDAIIIDAPESVLNEKKLREKERHKSLRKRLKKIKQKLNARSEEYLKTFSSEKPKSRFDSASRNKLIKSIKDIEKLLNTHGVSDWPNNAITMLERCLWEMYRILDKKYPGFQDAFIDVGGFRALGRLYNLALDIPKSMSPYLPAKCFITASSVFVLACDNSANNCVFALLSNKIIPLIDLFLARLNFMIPTSSNNNRVEADGYKSDSIADAVMNVISVIMTHATDGLKKQIFSNDAEVRDHIHDIISYTVCTGVVDKLAVYCSSIHDNKTIERKFLLHCIQFLTCLTEANCTNVKKNEDTTQVMATLRATELVGAVSMLYGILLNQDSRVNDGTQSAMPELHPDIIAIILATLTLFTKVAELNLTLFQSILGAEGISLQVRHITSYILRYCTQQGNQKELLHQLIEVIGFFAVHHYDNQMILQSGSTPTVLQQLSSLPFCYFSRPDLMKILFPTLLACCIDNQENRKLLDQEFSFQMLEDFQNSPNSKDIPLVQIL